MNSKLITFARDTLKEINGEDKGVFVLNTTIDLPQQGFFDTIAAENIKELFTSPTLAITTLANALTHRGRLIINHAGFALLNKDQKEISKNAFISILKRQFKYVVEVEEGIFECYNEKNLMRTLRAEMTSWTKVY